MNNHDPTSSSPYPVYANANLVIAFVAFLVTVTTANLWGIICFAAHQFYSTNQSRHTLHHQRQAILRNNTGPFGSFNMLVQLSWAWRKSKRRSLRRLVPLLVCIVVLMSGFTTASIFAARIATGTEALISSPSCGVIGNDVLLLIQRAAEPLDCGTYVKKRMPFTITTNASGPFDPSICTRTNGSLLLDTGYMDSHEDFGINAPRKDRWLFRKTTPESLYRRYFYGSNIVDDTNLTYEYPDLYEARKRSNASEKRDDYTLSETVAWYNNGSLEREISYVGPILQLVRPNADLSLYFLSSNEINFVGNTTADWYRARSYRGKTTGSWNGEGATPIYASDEPASPLACAQQQQRDVKYWFEVSLSAWQKGFVDSAVGVSNPDVESWVQAPNNTEEHKLCNSQKTRSTAHTSFSVFGLFFIIGTCILTTTVNFTLESITKCIQQRCRLNPYARLEWTSNHTLQLQRLTHEELGVGEWTNCDKKIPVILGPDVGLASLDLDGEDHPRLARGAFQGKEAPATKGERAGSMENMMATNETSSLQRIGSVPMLPQITVFPGFLADSASEVGIERGEDSAPRRGSMVKYF
ncbi:hypothetical protein PG988_009114 [Apiospora saccharicola]